MYKNNVDKLLHATLNVVKSRGEEIFLDVSRPYAYTLVAEFDKKKFLMKISADAEDVSGSAVKDLKILGKYTTTPALCIISGVRGRVLQRGVVYIRDDIVFMSLSTFKDVLDGKLPLFKLNRGVITATIRGDKLRERRESADMSLGALANELGVTRETVYRYERGEIEAPLKIANKLIIMFGEDIIKKIDITNIEVSKEELLSRRIDNNTYRLVESHPDAVRVEKNVFLISTDRDRYEKTKELAEALGAQFEKM